MSTRYNTGNPIESTDVRDMSDNAKNLDLFSNSSELSFDDRLGMERKTIHGMNSEFDAQILNMGFTRVGTFATGATLTNPRQTLLWDIADGGDGQEYGWSGAFPKVVPPLSTPNTTGGISVGKWMSRFDPELRVQVRESLRRSYAEAGYTLVAGGFEAGGALVNATDVLLYEADGKAYSWGGTLPKTVIAGSTPSSSGGIGAGVWTDRSTAPNAFKQSGTGAVLRTAEEKMREMITPHDFASPEAMIAEAIGRARTAAVFNSYFAFTITAGVGGDYPTLLEALIAAQAMRPFYDNGQAFCEVKLKTGYVLNTQIAFGAGADLSWIKITSEDAVVYADTASFTVAVRAYYEYKYLFYFKEGAKSPLFAIQIEENRTNSDVCAFLVTQSAELNFLPYSGGRKFYVGIHASFGAKVMAYHTGCAPDAGSVATHMPPGYYVCDFSYSRYASLQLVSQVVASMVISKFDYCTEFNRPSVNCVYNVDADFQGSSAAYSYIGWNVRDGSRVNIRDHKTIHCTYRGLTCIHTAYVDARRHDVEEVDIETSGKVLNPAVENGFFGCALGVRIDGAGCVDVAGNDMRNCGTAINADTGAVVSGKAVDISDCSLGFDCHAGAVIAFPRLWGTNVKKLMHLQDGCKFNSNVCHVYGSTPTTGIRWIDNERSEVVIMNAVIEADSGIMNDCGSVMTIETSTTKVQSIRSFFGSRVAIYDTKADKTYSVAASVPQVIISGGSFIAANGYTNLDSTPLKLSVTRNTLGIAGAIFSIDGVP